ncbi:MAG: hypothetical protein OHK0022_17380 [Roseiflexaceae bacterium]
MPAKDHKPRQEAVDQKKEPKHAPEQAEHLPNLLRRASTSAGSMQALQRAIGNQAVGRLVAGGIQRLHSNDYQRAQANANGRSDMQNVVDDLAAAIRGNLAALDENGYWEHINDRNHNANPVVGNDSSFGGEAQATIRGYIDHVLTNYAPILQDSQLIYDGTGVICNGIHRLGPRRGVRVILNVADVQDDVAWADQIAFVQIVNAYPI